MDSMASTATAAGGSYEFDAAQNEVIRRAGARTRWWGIFTLAVGVLMIAGALVAILSGGAAAILGGLVYGAIALIPVFVGLNFIRSGKALQAVVATTGSDIGHLMRALDNLSRAFLIQIAAAAVWIALGVIGAILAATVS